MADCTVFTFWRLLSFVSSANEAEISGNVAADAEEAPNLFVKSYYE